MAATKKKTIASRAPAAAKAKAGDTTEAIDRELGALSAETAERFTALHARRAAAAARELPKKDEA